MNYDDIQSRPSIDEHTAQEEESQDEIVIGTVTVPLEVSRMVNNQEGALIFLRFHTEENISPPQAAGKYGEEDLATLKSALINTKQGPNSQTVSFGIKSELAFIANEFTTDSLQALTITRALRFNDALKVNLSTATDAEILYAAKEYIRTSLLAWNAEEGRIRMLGDHYASQIAHASNNVIELRHTPGTGDGSKQDYGEFTITINTPQLIQFNQELQAAKRVKTLQTPKAAATPQQVVASSTLETPNTLEAPVIDSSPILPEVIATESPADDAQISSEPVVEVVESAQNELQIAETQDKIEVEDPVQANTAAPPVDAAERRKHLLDLEDEFKKAPSIYEMYQKLQKLANEGGVLHARKSKRDIEYQASEQVKVFEEILNLMDSGNWVAIIDIIDGKTKELSSGSYLSAVLINPLTEVCRTKYSSQLDMIRSVQKARTLEEAYDALRGFPDIYFILPRGLYPDNQVGNVYRFKVVDVINAIIGKNYESLDLRTANKLLPRLSELVAQQYYLRVTPAEQGQVQERKAAAPAAQEIEKSPHLDRLATLFGLQIKLNIPGKEPYYNNSVAAELSKAIAADLLKTFPCKRGDEFRRIVIIIDRMKTIPDGDRPHSRFADASATYTYQQYFAKLQVVKNALVSNSLNRIDLKTIPSVLGLHSLIEVAKKPAATAEDFMREIGHEYATSARIPEKRGEQSAQRGGIFAAIRRWNPLSR
jgi:hypothetical protein